MIRIVRAGLAMGLLAAASAAARPARAADPKTAECLSATESSLALRHQHKLRDARAKLLVCSADSCPVDIRNECIHRVAEINAAIPTIVFEARDAAGNDLGAVKVTMDGEVLAERLDGIALSIDPGARAFTFATAGHPAVGKQFLIREGEKDRRERIVFGRPSAVAATPLPVARPTSTITESTAPTLSARPEPRRSGTQRALAVAAAGVGIVGLGVGTGFGLYSSSKHGDAVKACPSPQCADQNGVDLWNQARSAGTISTVAFIVGAVGVAGGAVLWFTDNPKGPGVAKTEVGFGLGSLQLKGVW
jgi:hypothetical protein